MMVKILILILSLTALSCSEPAKDKVQSAEIDKLRIEIENLNKFLSEKTFDMEQQIMTSLTFQKNDAEEAMNFYVGLFDHSKVTDVKRWGAEGPGREGSIMTARFELNGQPFLCSDSPPIHNWDFTPAVSNYVECESANQIENLFEKLSEGGEAAMPLNHYGFSTQFAWVIDRFGVSWQLNLK